MNTGKVGFGLVGTGMGADIHALQIKELEYGELTGVYGRNEQRARQFADKHGAKRWYTDYRQFLDDEAVDAVIIVTPNGLHLDFAIPAAQAGKHVVVEKPLEITVERGREIIDACRRHGVMLSVIYQLRFGSNVRKIKEAVDSGALGRVFLCDAYDKEYRQPDYYANDYWRGTKAYEGGGALMTQSTHVIDLLRWLIGPVASVVASKRTAVHKIDVEDLVVAVLKFRNGCLGVLESSTCTYPGFKSRIEVHGEKGSAIVNPEYDELVFWEIAGSDEKLDTPPGFQFGDVSDPHLLPMTCHKYQLQDIVDAIREGREPLVGGDDGLAALEIKQAIYESACLGREVEVRP